MSPRALVEPAAPIASPAERGRSAKPPVGESGPVLLLWGWSRLDGRAHAIDPTTEHPVLVYVARCGHRVLRRTVLCDVPQGVQPQAAPPEVHAGTCTRCGMGWACTVIGVLPTPQLRTAAFLTVLRAEVTRRSGKDPAP